MDYYRPMRTTRTIKDVAQVQKLPWYRINNQADGPAMVSIFNEIGGPFGITAGDFVAELASIDGDLELHVNSPGGDVFDAVTIFNTLKQRKGSVTVIVDGLAASAASFIAQAASPGQLLMAPHSRMMIHDGFGVAMGNAADMRSTADLLDQVSDDIASMYAERSGKPQDYWRGKMRAETWLSDKQTVAEGLADGIVGQNAPANDWDLSVYAFSNADGNGWMQRDGKWVFDPENDGDDDYQASTDTDHDYWSADGTQLKSIPAGPPGSGKAAKPLTTTSNSTSADILNAKYNTDDRKRMASNGEAMADGSYPIADAEDLDNAIRAVGRGNGDHGAIRQHIIKRAKALGLSSKIPDNWGDDGSLQSNSSSESVDMRVLAALFTSALEGGV